MVYSTGDKTWSGHEVSEHKEDAFSIQHWKLSLKIYHIVHYRLKVQEHFFVPFISKVFSPFILVKLIFLTNIFVYVKRRSMLTR